jgi:hypothetical protein
MKSILFFYFIVYLMPSSAATLVEGFTFCTYRVSGTYGVSARYILYTLYATGIAIHKIDWLVGATFGTAMLFSSVTSVHMVAMEATQRPYYYDSDTEPALTMIMCSLLAASMLFMWSSSFRRATDGARIMVFAWFFLMIVGFIAGFVYMSSALSEKLPDGKECTDHIVLRKGQESFVSNLRYTPVPFFIIFTILLPPQLILALRCGIIRRSPIALSDRPGKYKGSRFMLGLLKFGVWEKVTRMWFEHVTL